MRKLKVPAFILQLLPLWVLATILIGFSYVGLQQNYRMNANDPQVQMSYEMAEQLAKGVDTRVVIGTNIVDLSKSISPFAIVFDESGKAYASSALVDGKIPAVPLGVIENAKKTGENRLTWQPKKGIREAIIVKKFDGKNKGFVLVGRSLSEVEKRIDMLGLYAAFAWLASVVVILASKYIP